MVVATVVVVSVGVLGGLANCSPVAGPEPIRCSPCTPEKLSQCPAIAPDCRQVLREPGCGCCMACALDAGSSCGVHTAHCGQGLRCAAGPGEPRPLHALIRGQGVCTQEQGTGEDPPTPPSLPLSLSLSLMGKLFSVVLVLGFNCIFTVVFCTDNSCSLNKYLAFR